MNLSKSLFFTLLTFTSSLTWAGYLSLGESGEMPAKEYQIGVAPQIALNNDEGLNAAVFLDKAWDESTSSRFMLGAGEVDFYGSGSVKFVPFPDFERQPAIGFKAALWHARIGDENVTTVQLAPLVSKKYETSEYGLLIPYAAYGISFYEYEGDSTTGEQFFIGTDWRSPQIENINFTAEWAVSLKDSTSALTFLATIPFDSKSGF